MESKTAARLQGGMNGRNYGIDLLRIVAMNMIVLLHVLGTGGVLDHLPRFSAGYVAAWVIEMASFGAVNVFALISGYVNYGRRTKYSNLLLLCLQMLFYTIVCTGIFFVVSPQRVTRQTIVYSLLPFKIGGYWYFAAYFCLFLLMPFLNALIDRLSAGSAAKLLLVCFVAFSVLPTLLFQDIGGLRNGYSVSWLAVMYAVGACVRKFDFRLKRGSPLVFYLLCVAVSLSCKLLMEGITYALTGQVRYGNLFAAYISPFIVLSSVFLLLLFRDMKPGKAWIRLIGFFAPMTFSVYLLHMEPLVKDTFLVGKFAGYAKMDPLRMTGCVLLTGAAIWLACSLIDWLRIGLFRWLRIQPLCVRIEKSLKHAAVKAFPLLVRS